MTVISAYEPVSGRYGRLIKVMTGFNAVVQPRYVRGGDGPALRPATPTLVSLHEHKGELQVVTNIPLEPLERELIGLLWEFQSEPRTNITYETADDI